MKKIDMKAIFRILTLTVVATLFAGSSYADTNFIIYGQSYLDLSYSTPKTLTQSGNTYTYSFVATATGNNQSFKIYKNSQSDNTALCCETQSLQFNHDPYPAVIAKSGSTYKNELNMSVVSGASYSINVEYTDDNNCTISISQTSSSYTVNAAAVNGLCDAASKQCIPGGSVTFTITPNEGYAYSSYTYAGEEESSKVVRDGNTYTVTPDADNQTLTVTFAAQTYTVTPSFNSDHCSVEPSAAQTVSYNGYKNFTVTPKSSYYLDKGNTKFSGNAKLEFEDNTIKLTEIKESGTLTIVCATSQTPVVYWAQYPVVGVNAISLYGYLGERYCKTVEAAGFYWSTSPISDQTVRELVIAGTASDNIIPTTTTPVSDFVNGTNFLGSVDANNTTFAAITDPTVIYLVNYVKTSGGVGISDHVAVYYQPCKGMQSLTLSPAEASVAVGHSTDFSVVARSAGKSPVYAWYLDQTDTEIAGGTATAIEGANSDTYSYTMSSPAATHTLKVKVTDQCGNVQWTHDSPVVEGVTATKRADITGCDTPSFDIAADKLTTTPWTARTISITNAQNYYSADWCVEPASAELSTLTKDWAVFRAPVESGTSTTYTITYTAKGACGNSTVEVSKSIEIKVQADSEDCSN